MKVVFTSLFKEGQGGGEGRVAHEIAHKFAEMGHETVMICPAEQTGLHAQEENYRVFGIRAAGQGEFWMPALSSRTVNSVFDFLDDFNPDVIHAHDPALIGLVGQVWAKMHMVPFVHTSHVLPHDIFKFGAADALDVKLLQTSLSEAVAREALTDFYDNCDAIIALNKSALQSLRKFGYQGKVFIIPNGRNLAQYEDCKIADVESSSEKILTFIGFISERKNQSYLLEVMIHLPTTYQLRLIGGALNPDYERQIKRFCKRHNLDNVAFLGKIPHEEIPPRLEETHAFVSASTMEVQSLVIIEALASGTPVVGLVNETIEELVNDEVGCQLPHETAPKAFARCVEQLCSLSQTEYAALCERARARVAELDWSNVVEETVEAYEELLQQKHAAKERQSEQTRLSELIASLPEGEFKDILTEQIEERRQKQGLWARIKRVPGSTWLLTGATILASLIGYLMMKGKGRAQEL